MVLYSRVGRDPPNLSQSTHIIFFTSGENKTDRNKTDLGT